MANRTGKACLITNPRSGRGGIDLSPALAVLQAQGWQAEVRQKLHGGHATELARDAAGSGYDVVVNCGGDGTLSEIVDGLAGTDVAVGTLPGGTENVWAHEVGISQRLRVAATQLVGAARRRVDVGHVAINGRHGQHFLLMAGLGLDGAIMARVSKPLKNRIGPLAVGLAALETLPSYSAMPVRAELDGVRWQGRVSQIIVGNTRRYGGFTSITADAYIDDGLLDVCFITASGVLDGTRQAAALLLRQRPSAASAESYRVSALTIHASAVMPLQVDGGAVHHKDIQPTANGIAYTLTIAPQSLTVLVPRTYNGALFQRGPLPAPLTRLALAPPADGEQRRHGRGVPHSGKDQRKAMRVIATGVDTITAARVDSGRVVTILIDRDTTFEDATGDERSPRRLFSHLAQGDLMRVKGTKDRDRGTIQARHIRVLTPPTERVTTGSNGEQ